MKKLISFILFLVASKLSFAMGLGISPEMIQNYSAEMSQDDSAETTSPSGPSNKFMCQGKRLYLIHTHMKIEDIEKGFFVNEFTSNVKCFETQDILNDSVPGAYHNRLETKKNIFVCFKEQSNQGKTAFETKFYMIPNGTPLSEIQNQEEYSNSSGTPCLKLIRKINKRTGQDQIDYINKKLKKL